MEPLKRKCLWLEIYKAVTKKPSDEAKAIAGIRLAMTFFLGEEAQREIVVEGNASPLDEHPLHLIPRAILDGYWVSLWLRHGFTKNEINAFHHLFSEMMKDGPFLITNKETRFNAKLAERDFPQARITSNSIGGFYIREGNVALAREWLTRSNDCQRQWNDCPPYEFEHNEYILNNLDRISLACHRIRNDIEEDIRRG